MSNKYPFIPYEGQGLTDEEMKEKSKAFYEYMHQRRSVREYDDREIPREVLENIIKAAGTAPSARGRRRRSPVTPRPRARR